MVTLAIYLAGTIAGLVIFVVAFMAGVLNSIPILFYRGLALLPVVAALHVTLMWGVRLLVRRGGARPALAGGSLATIIGLGAMLNLAFFMLLPVNLDRSISVFLLSWMEENGAVDPSRSAIEAAFQRIYVEQYGAIDRRIAEQLASGNIVATAEGYRLTERGHAFVATARAVGGVFSVDPRFLHPGGQTQARR